MDDKNIQEILDNADTGSSTPETIRNTAIDLGTGALLGALFGGIKSKAFSKKPAKEATKEALEQLKKGKDTSLGHQKSIIERGASHDSEIKKMMKQNEDAARNLFEGGDSKKALNTVVKNSQREAEIGPRFMKDIKHILQSDTGLSEKEVEEAIKDYVSKNADNADLLKLIEAKDPIATYSHSKGVQDITYKLAKEQLGFSEEEAKRLADAALIHDIGKVQVPDAIINGTFWKKEYPELFAWMEDHDIKGGDILKSDKFKSDVAKGHHPKNRGGSSGSVEEDAVTVADLYEAMTSKKRSYKKSHPKDEAFKFTGEELEKSKVSQDYLGFLKALDEDGLLKDYYDYPSPLEAPYKSMKANAIKKQVASDYDKKFFEDALKKNVPHDAALGGVVGTTLPTLSEILTELSPSFKTKAEKLEDIRNWYKNGHSNDEIDKLIVDTDFKNNKQVTKLWKLMKEQFKD